MAIKPLRAAGKAIIIYATATYITRKALKAGMTAARAVADTQAGTQRPEGLRKEALRAEHNTLMRDQLNDLASHYRKNGVDWYANLADWTLNNHPTADKDN